MVIQHRLAELLSDRIRDGNQSRHGIRCVVLGYPPCTMWPAKLPSDELVTSFTVRMNSPSAGGLALGR